MPKHLHDIRDFVRLLKQGEPKKVTVHKTTMRTPAGAVKPITKFKIRCKRYLYTLIMDNREKADKMLASLPRSVVHITQGAKGKAKASKPKAAAA